MTMRKYTLPDRTVASQVLMYRQLLHTACRPGLRLSRKFEGTPAQRAVVDMPWWERGIEQTRRMVISYDNLIVRLWLGGAIMPFVEGGFAHDPNGRRDEQRPKGGDGGGEEEGETGGGVAAAASEKEKEKEEESSSPPDLLSGSPPPSSEPAASTAAAAEKVAPDGKDDAADGDGGGASSAPSSSSTSRVDTLIDDRGLPPVPHPYWIKRLGFQQPDPVTDFRSGGVLSLAMLVHIVESCPAVHARFLPGGDAAVLPFGITCINVTDMLAKFLMFSKSVDRIDALLSQKPFWRMFADPSAMLVLEELSMDALADVVVELGRERKLPNNKHGGGGHGGTMTNLHGEREGNVTVFDFAEILSRTEERVLNDLLGAGPKTVGELRYFHARNRARYAKAIKKKEDDAAAAAARAAAKHEDDAGHPHHRHSVVEPIKNALGTIKQEVSKRGSAMHVVHSPKRGGKGKNKEEGERLTGKHGDGVEEEEEMDFSSVSDPDVHKGAADLAMPDLLGGDFTGGGGGRGGAAAADRKLRSENVEGTGVVGRDDEKRAGAEGTTAATAGNDGGAELAGAADAFVIGDDDDDDELL